ncbi:hypothetical protein TNCV_1602181 [Trichonephila clavipes]|nr:hypothetical protein TNCV_1602181 [Trichonephila clavipes]
MTGQYVTRPGRPGDNYERTNRQLERDQSGLNARQQWRLKFLLPTQPCKAARRNSRGSRSIRIHSILQNNIKRRSPSMEALDAKPVIELNSLFLKKKPSG